MTMAHVKMKHMAKAGDSPGVAGLHFGAQLRLGGSRLMQWMSHLLRCTVLCMT